MTKIIIFIVVVVAGFLIIQKYFPAIFSQNTKNKPLYKYKRRDFLMSRVEHEFFDILIEIVGDRFYVFPQVHLPNVLDHKIIGQNWKGAFSHINQKSVDYVICDKAYIKPLLVIELDDKTHEREDRIERDEKVENILKDADLPLLRFENKSSFNKEYIKREIDQKLN